jgi:hypothetical protein
MLIADHTSTEKIIEEGSRRRHARHPAIRRLPAACRVMAAVG